MGIAQAQQGLMSPELLLNPSRAGQWAHSPLAPCFPRVWLHLRASPEAPWSWISHSIPGVPQVTGLTALALVGHPVPLAAASCKQGRTTSSL